MILSLFQRFGTLYSKHVNAIYFSPTSDAVTCVALPWHDDIELARVFFVDGQQRASPLRAHVRGHVHFHYRSAPRPTNTEAFTSE